MIGSDINVSLLDQTRTTDYVGNKVYEDGNLKRILVDGGYIENNTYYFHITDHLGNNRVALRANGTIIQRSHYYPFGMSYAEGTGQDRTVSLTSTTARSWTGVWA